MKSTSSAAISAKWQTGAATPLAAASSAIPAHFLDIGAGEPGDIPARFVVTRAFGDHGSGLRRRLPNRASGDSCRTSGRCPQGGEVKPCNAPASFPSFFASHAGVIAPGEVGKLMRPGSIRPVRPVGAWGPTNNCSSTPTPCSLRSPSVSSARTNACTCIASGLPHWRSGSDRLSCAISSSP